MVEEGLEGGLEVAQAGVPTASQTVLDKSSTECSSSFTKVHYTRELGLVQLPPNHVPRRPAVQLPVHLHCMLSPTLPLPHFPALAPVTPPNFSAPPTLHPHSMPHPHYSTPLFPHVPTPTLGPEQVDESQLRPSAKTVETHRTTQQESRTAAATTTGGARGPGAGGADAGAPGAAGEPADIYKAGGDIEYDEAQVRVLSGGRFFFLFNIARRYLPGRRGHLGTTRRRCVWVDGVCVVLCGGAGFLGVEGLLLRGPHRFVSMRGLTKPCKGTPCSQPPPAPIATRADSSSPAPPPPPSNV